MIKITFFELYQNFINKNTEKKTPKFILLIKTIKTLAIKVFLNYNVFVKTFLFTLSFPSATLDLNEFIILNEFTIL